MIRRHRYFAQIASSAACLLAAFACGNSAHPGATPAAGSDNEGGPSQPAGSGTDDAGASEAAIEAAIPIPDTDAALNSWFDGSAPLLPANGTVHIAGDSTAAIFPPTDPTARVGWGAVLQPFFTAAATVDDAARSGRSSKSFIDEGLWAALEATIRPGDYVLIQFGHNDEKTGDPALYTDAATTFRQYLSLYVTGTRAAGGFPVLLTPISRRQFSGSTVVNTHGAYPAAVIDVGAATGTPVIDMTAKTTAWLESLGPTASVPMFATGDNTHLSAMGAPQVAAMVVQGIRELPLPLAAALQ
jgi:lysophospholipase L1-like esterase